MGSVPPLPMFNPQGAIGSGQVAGGGGLQQMSGSPFKPNKAANVAQGLQQLLTSWWGTKEALRTHYDGEVERALSMIQNGLINPKTADMKKIVKSIERSHYGQFVKTSEPTPEESQYQDQKNRSDQLAKAAQSMMQYGAPQGQMPGLQAAAAQNLMQGAQASAPGAPPVPPRPGIMQRLGFNRPPASANSPVGQFLSDLAAKTYGGAPMNPDNAAMAAKLGNMGQALQGMNMQQQMQAVGLFQNALDENNPKHLDAMRTLVQSGILPNTPMNELIWASRMAGGTESDAARMYLYGKIGNPMLMKSYEIAKDLLPRTGGDPNAALQAARDLLHQGYTNVPVGMTVDEASKITEGMSKLLDQRDLPPNLAYGIAAADILPSFKGIKDQMLDAASKFPSKQSQSYQEWQADYGLRQRMTGADIDHLYSDIGLRQDQLAVNVVQAIGEAGDREMKQAYAVLNDPKADATAKQAALQRLSSVNLKESQVKIPIPGQPGQTYRITDPTSVSDSLNAFQKRWLPGTPYIQGQTPPPDIFKSPELNNILSQPGYHSRPPFAYQGDKSNWSPPPFQGPAPSLPASDLNLIQSSMPNTPGFQAPAGQQNVSPTNNPQNPTQQDNGVPNE